MSPLEKTLFGVSRIAYLFAAALLVIGFICILITHLAVGHTLAYRIQ